MDRAQPAAGALRAQQVVDDDDFDYDGGGGEVVDGGSGMEKPAN